MGQLSSVIAHEIRNPLGLIDLYSKLVETQVEQLLPDAADTDAGIEASLSEDRQKLNRNILHIREAVSSLETILSELTQYARPLELNRHATDIPTLVQSVCDFYQPSFAQQQVQLHVKEAVPTQLSLNVDADRIRQALINLFKNALEVSEAGHTVTVSVNLRHNDNKIFIKVQDQGPGIRDDIRERLFTPYCSTKVEGTGLGLAHSRKILQAHGGSVDLLASSPATGSLFALILPTEAL